MDERSLRWEQRFEWPMVIAALLVIPLLVIEESVFRLLRLLRLGRLFSLRNLLSLEGVRYAALLAIFAVLLGGAAYPRSRRTRPERLGRHLVGDHHGHDGRLRRQLPDDRRGPG